MTDDDLVAGVVAELDALLPVLAEEVTALVAERHGVAVPLDVAPVVAALRGLRDIDDTSVERAVLGALGHHTDGDLMAEKEDPKKEPRQEEKPDEEKPPVETALLLTPDEPDPYTDDWVNECPPPTIRTFSDDWDFPADDDSVDVAIAALRIDLTAKAYAPAIVKLAAMTRSGELDRGLVCCDDVGGLAQRSLCLETEAKTYQTRSAEFVRRVLGRGSRGEIARAWARLLKYLDLALCHDDPCAWRRAEAAAAELRLHVGFMTTLYDRILAHGLMQEAYRFQKTVERTGNPLQSLPGLTGLSVGYVYDLHLDCRAHTGALMFAKTLDKVHVEPHEHRLFGHKPTTFADKTAS